MQATQQKLEVQLEELDRRFWSRSLTDPDNGAYGSGVYRFVAHVLTEGVDLCGRPFAMARQDAELDDRPTATAPHARARLCGLVEPLPASGWPSL
ncbi:MAG: hypothetical protein ACTHKG_03195, partial [Nocardioides sp.]